MALKGWIRFLGVYMIPETIEVVYTLYIYAIDQFLLAIEIARCIAEAIWPHSQSISLIDATPMIPRQNGAFDAMLAAHIRLSTSHQRRAKTPPL